MTGSAIEVLFHVEHPPSSPYFDRGHRGVLPSRAEGRRKKLPFSLFSLSDAIVMTFPFPSSPVLRHTPLILLRFFPNPRERCCSLNIRTRSTAFPRFLFGALKQRVVSPAHPQSFFPVFFLIRTARRGCPPSSRFFPRLFLPPICPPPGNPRFQRFHVSKSLSLVPFCVRDDRLNFQPP